jgi:hypothetical protein
MCYNFFFNYTICDIMWKNMVEQVGHRWQDGAYTLHARYLRLYTQSDYVVLALPLQN